MDKEINKITDDEKNERFFVNPKEFDVISQPKKVSISKSELSKAVNVGAESGEPGFVFIPQVYDNKKLEDETAKDMESWLKDIQKDLEKELDKFYGEL